MKMTNNINTTTPINVTKLFNESVQYEIPIYQRNYAWKAEHIEQLIDDIYDNQKRNQKDKQENNYYLGNLIVNQKESNIFEVIDGQQRLTTLFLLLKYLELKPPSDSLKFEARDISNKTLKNIGSESNREFMVSEIVEGYETIERYFKTKQLNEEKFKQYTEKFKQLLTKIILIRIEVPPNIDLNHYFEVMNTRGEQLEAHDIFKAKLLNQLNAGDKLAAAKIWDACAQMNTYVQMNFTPKEREKLFGDAWDHFEIKDFNEIKEELKSAIDNENNKSAEPSSLFNILDNKEEIKNSPNNTNSEKEENERFESIISFPNFILQVCYAMSKNDEKNDEDESLNDKQFLSITEQRCVDADSAKEFLYSLLKYRFLFDTYIIKREFAKDYKDTGKWSLQRLKSNNDENKSTKKPSYVNTFGNSSSEDNENSNAEGKNMRTLQACLRITYTSPKTMHWIHIALEFLNNPNEAITSNELSKKLEEYCAGKLKTSKDNTGFKIPRIMFTYLDYLLYKDRENNKYKLTNIDNFEFQFRNSIEHFYPQNPPEGHDPWDEDLNCFGNLCLITVSGNSKFSNLLPQSKINTYEKTKEQSLKLQIMAEKAKDGWTQKTAAEHGKNMLALLNDEIEKNKAFPKTCN